MILPSDRTTKMGNNPIETVIISYVRIVWSSRQWITGKKISLM
jgi:hypothetical protein